MDGAASAGTDAAPAPDDVAEARADAAPGVDVGDEGLADDLNASDAEAEGDGQTPAAGNGAPETNSAPDGETAPTALEAGDSDASAEPLPVATDEPGGPQEPTQARTVNPLQEGSGATPTLDSAAARSADTDIHSPAHDPAAAHSPTARSASAEAGPRADDPAGEDPAAAQPAEAQPSAAQPAEAQPSAAYRSAEDLADDVSGPDGASDVEVAAEVDTGAVADEPSPSPRTGPSALSADERDTERELAATGVGGSAVSSGGQTATALGASASTSDIQVASRSGLSPSGVGPSAAAVGLSTAGREASAAADGTSAVADGHSARADGAPAVADGASARADGAPAVVDGASARRAWTDAARPTLRVESPPPERVYATAFLPASIPPSKELRLPESTNEVREYIRQVAIDRNIDPDIAVRVALSEGGLTPATWTGDHGSSFGPYQLHYGRVATGGNAVGGLGDAFTAETGLQANDPQTWRQQIEWALNHAAGSGWTPWHGAASTGIGAFEGIGDSRTTARPRTEGAHPHVDVPNQFAAQLSAPEAYAACGPVAAVAVARWLGRNPTVIEAVDTAKRTGWTVGGGMNGIANEKRLLDAMRVPVSLQTSVNWRSVQLDASSGNPVIISTPQHYWVIDDFDSTTGSYHVGQSGLAFRGGAEWMSAAQIQQFGGPPNGALFVDHPLVPQPSLATSPEKSDLQFDRWWESESV